MRMLLIAVVLGASTAALAQTDVVLEEEPSVRYHQVTKMIFTEIDVKGALKGPAGTYLRAKKKTRFRSLIELRSSFAPELEKTAGAM